MGLKRIILASPILIPILLSYNLLHATEPIDTVSVPAGPFIMGTDHPRATDEKPSRQVQLSAFAIDRREVTSAAYAAFVLLSLIFLKPFRNLHRSFYES